MLELSWSIIAVVVSLMAILVPYLLIISLTPAKCVLPTNLSLEGKVIIITGSNSGIGKATAKELAKLKARIIMACRSKERAEEAIREIKKETNNQNIEFMQLDLCSLNSVRKFANDFREMKIPCHVLINNAGVFYFGSHFIGTSPTKTEDGFNVQWISNYLGHFLLTHLLLDILSESSTRIINVTSSLHFFTQINFDDVQGFKCPLWISYSRSKLAQIYFTYKLQKMLKNINSKATVNAVHPGYIATGIVDYMPRWIYFTYRWIFEYLLGLDASTGCSGPLYLAASPDVEKIGGKYFSGPVQYKSSKISYNESIGERIWITSQRMTGLTL